MNRFITQVMRTICVAAVLGVFTAGHAPASTDEAVPPPPPLNETLRGLPAVAVFVDSLPANIEERGITAGVLGAHIISRLKEGGIQVVNLDPTVPTPGAPLLSVVAIMVLDEGVNSVMCGIRMELIQMVRLEHDPDIVAPAATWSISGVGMYGEDWRDTVVNDIIIYTGDFVAAHALANGLEIEEGH